MKRFHLAASAGALALIAGLMLIAAASAGAKVVELGQTSTPLAPPPPCTTPRGSSVAKCPHGTTGSNYFIELTQITALETMSDGNSFPTVAHQAGRIVAFTVGLSALDTNRSARKSEIHQADTNLGGTPQVQIAVLRWVGSKTNKRWKVVAESPAVHVEPYLGYVVQFPLTTTLPVKAGDVIALTTPTWAPVLSVFQDPKKFSYRQSRSDNCSNPPVFNESQSVGNSATYGCSYTGTRVEYTATEVTTTPYPKGYVH